MHPLIPKATPIDPEMDFLVQSHGRSAEALLPVLRALNSQRGGLSRETLIQVAQSFGTPLKRPEELATFYAMLSAQPDQREVIRLCEGIACWLKRSDQCREALAAELANHDRWKVTRSSCLGLCDRARQALVEDRQCGPLAAEHVGRLCSGWSGHPPNIAEPRAGETRLLLARAGRIDPLSIAEAIAGGAYQGFLSALEGTTRSRSSPGSRRAGLKGIGRSRLSHGTQMANGSRFTGSAEICRVQCG